MSNINQFYNNSILIEFNRSEYYPLQPIGIGTPFVESLTGYISRLAKSHCLKPSELVIDLEEDKGRFYKRIGDRITTDHASIMKLYALNGINEHTSKYVETLEGKTQRRDIIYTTILPITNIISRLGLLRKTRAWCPVCYEEALESGSSIYDQLAWNFQTVSECTKHKIKLVEQCPNCSKRNFAFKGNIMPGFCTQCGGWLGSRKDVIKEDASGYNYWKTNQISKLISKLPSINNDNLMNILVNNIKDAIKLYTHGDITEFAKVSGIEKSTIVYWVNNNGKPSINELLYLCYVLSVDLTSLITIPNLSFKHSIRNIVNIKNQYKIDKQVIYESLIQVIEDYSQDPVSLTEVTRRLKVHKKLLLSNFPELCEEINFLYKNLKTKQKA